jgi:hypothetical protein
MLPASAIAKPRVIHKKVGPDFPGETFRVLKEKENAYFGKYGRQMVNIN